MNNIHQLEHDTYYHIFNRGINGENLFKEENNYLYFLKLYEEHIGPVAETIAWCLMKNHFHFLIQTLPEDQIGYIVPKIGDNRTFHKKVKYNPSRQFANLFNAYAKAYNKRYGRTGGLFENPFRRTKVTEDDYLKKLIFYIHNNPVKHGFEEKIQDYRWSSYSRIISSDHCPETFNSVIDLFGNCKEFIAFHNRNQEGVDWEGF